MTRLRYFRRWKADKQVDFVDEVPAIIRRRHAVIVGSAVRQKWLIFSCPCARGHQVMLNTDPENFPTWRILQTTPLTLSPSVNEKSHVGHCHYILRDGRVQWVERT